MIWRSKPVGLALVGCGNMGRVHAQAITRNKRCRLMAVYDPERARCEQFKAEFDVGSIADSFETVLENQRIEGVLLVTPHHLHFEQVMRALDAGKHVFVEKPVALNAKETETMCAHATKSNRRLLVGHIMRFWPNVQRARLAIQGGEIGNVTHITRRRLVYQKDAGRPWAHDPAQSGGWLIHGVTVHEIDALLYLADLKIKEVLAVVNQTNVAWADIDELSALIRFDGGAVGSLVHTLNSHIGSLETVIIGTKGSIFLSDWHRGYALNGQLTSLSTHEGHGEQLHWFLRAIREGRETPIDGDAILPTMHAIDLIREKANLYSEHVYKTLQVSDFARVELQL